MTTPAAQPTPDPLPEFPAGIISDPGEITSLLSPYRLGIRDLQDSIRFGLAEYLECTTNDPIHLPGVLLVGKAIRRLRDILVTREWETVNVRGYATVEHPSGRLAVTTALGDANTGSKLKSPRTSASKGAQSASYIEANQMSLFPAMFPGPIRHTTDQTTGLILLVHVFDGEQVVNAELSRPIGTDHHRRISKWRTRLILPQASFSELSIAATPSQPPDLDFQVTWKDQ